MKIAFNTQNIELINEFIKAGKEFKIDLLNAKVENVLLNIIENNEADAYIIDASNPSLEKIFKFIKKQNENIQVILLVDSGVSIEKYYNKAIIIPLVLNHSILTRSCITNLNLFYNSFNKMQKLTAKMSELIEFGKGSYDPTRRILTYDGKEFKKLSGKEGGIIETLAANFGQVVKKEVILEKVWHKTDYFAGRSADVYITHLRKMFTEKKVKLSIKNITGVGLILE